MPDAQHKTDDRPKPRSGADAWLRVLLLAAGAGVAALLATSLLFATDPYIEVVAQVAHELEPVDRVRGREGPSLEAYNECIARLVAERAKNGPCPAGDEDCLQRLSAARCVKPTEVDLVAKGDVDSALAAGGQVQGPVRSMLVQRQTLALAQLWQLCQGYAGSLALGLLLAAAACYSALVASRSPLAMATDRAAVERHAKRGGLALGAAALLAAVAALAGGAQLSVAGWDHPRLIASVFVTKVGVGAALLAAAAAALGGWIVRRAFVALDEQDAAWEEAWDDASPEDASSDDADAAADESQDA